MMVDRNRYLLLTVATVLMMISFGKGSGPTCFWTRSSSGETNITCTIIYADHRVSPMNAIISYRANGQVYYYNTAASTKTLIKPYLYDSTTVITISNSSAETYDCRTAFTAPEDNVTSYIARNEPNFTANVTATRGHCLNYLENIVVYEGTRNTILRCGLGSKGERWAVRPTSLATREFQITNFTGSVFPNLTGLYAVNQSGFFLRNATIDTTATDPISTAGIYYVYFADGNWTAARLVIRSGPTCSWTRSVSGDTNITCTIIYADHPVSPMDATITCTADGQVYTATPNKTLIKPYLWNSTAVITISNSSAQTYDCRAAFTAPADDKIPYSARNEPNFTANVTVGPTYKKCMASAINTVVYEGTENTILSCGLGPNGEKWTVRPTSDAVREYQITNFTSSVSPTLTGLYAINQSGLVIRNATIDPTGGSISTAGLYYVYFADGNKNALKLVVIRSGPSCCSTQSSSAVSITCTIIYADHPVSPMNATITCTADGQVYTATPTKTLIKPYLWNSTTVITINKSSGAIYDCRAAFK